MAQNGARAWSWIYLCVGLIASLDATRAEACSWGPCTPGYLLPGTGGAIPANAPALVWQASTIPGGGSDGAVPDIKLVRLDLSSEQPTFRIVSKADGLNWLVLDQPLSVGGRYRLAVEGDCDTPATEFEVTAAAKLPTVLGTLTIGRPTPAVAVVATTSGSCSAGVAAVHALTNVKLSSAAKPWADLLMYETRVDGAIFQPQTTLVGVNEIPDAEATLFTECDDLYAPDMMRDARAFELGLGEGEHDVELVAQLPGADAQLSSAAVSVTLNCPASGVVPGAGVPADLSDSDDPAKSDSDDPAKSDRSSGCNVRLEERDCHPSRAWMSWSLLALGLFCSRRRRRHP